MIEANEMWDEMIGRIESDQLNDDDKQFIVEAVQFNMYAWSEHAYKLQSEKSPIEEPMFKKDLEVNFAVSEYVFDVLCKHFGIVIETKEIEHAPA